MMPKISISVEISYTDRILERCFDGLIYEDLTITKKAL